MPPLTRRAVARYLAQVLGWQAERGFKRIVRTFKFKNFVLAIRFVNRVAKLAEAEGHHPDFSISYSRVRIELWTHAVGGLSENDFILAAKINRLPAR